MGDFILFSSSHLPIWGGREGQIPMGCPLNPRGLPPKSPKWGTLSFLVLHTSPFGEAWRGRSLFGEGGRADPFFGEVERGRLCS